MAARSASLSGPVATDGAGGFGTLPVGAVALAAALASAFLQSAYVLSSKAVS